MEAILHSDEGELQERGQRVGKGREGKRSSFRRLGLTGLFKITGQ